MSATHFDHCRTQVVLGATCNCDHPAPKPDPEVLMCTTPTITGTVWHQGENTITTLEEVKARLEADKAEYPGGQYDQSIRDRQQLVTWLEHATNVTFLATDGVPVCHTEHPTGAQLDALAEGRRVVDATGDMWFKLHDGRWSFKNMTTSSATHLVDVWGPVRILPEVAE